MAIKNYKPGDDHPAVKAVEKKGYRQFKIRRYFGYYAGHKWGWELHGDWMPQIRASPFLHPRICQVARFSRKLQVPGIPGRL